MAVSNVELRVNATQAVNALKKVDTQSKKFNTTISGTSGKLKATTGSFKALPAGLLATGAGAKTQSIKKVNVRSGTSFDTGRKRISGRI